MVEKSTPSRKGGKRLERLRQVALATVIALVLHFLTIFAPLDQVGWIVQSRAANHSASGDIVFVGADTNLADPNNPAARRDLAKVIDALSEAGARSVYVDFAFPEATDEASDAALNAALRGFDGEAYLVRDVVFDLEGNPVLQFNTAHVNDGVREVGYEAWVEYMGYTWRMAHQATDLRETLPSFSTVLARKAATSTTEHPVSYGYNLRSIPKYRFEELRLRSTAYDTLAGKDVVISPTPIVSGIARQVPGHLNVPDAMIAIFAAETLRDGYTRNIPGWAAILVFAGLLAVVGGGTNRPNRRGLTMLIVLAIPAALLLASHAGVRLSVGDTIILALIYTILRTRTRWQERARRHDTRTNLPTFAALEEEERTTHAGGALIVAKIHRFENVRQSLPSELHSEYVLAVVSRLKASAVGTDVYLGPGHLLAWQIDNADPVLLRDHLEGTRALFASPLTVGSQQVDVGITFGVDLSDKDPITDRLAAAVVAAERTNETFDTIVFTEGASREDLIWNISLQSRIDAALSNGEIYLAFQPKVMLQTGAIVGAEALVRWNDPDRGHIAPDQFIKQCETAGRMSQLTRFVLLEACKAGTMLEAEGRDLPLAVNISATLLQDRAIVQMVRSVLEHTGFEAHRLTLEITETYRIARLDVAAEILSELSALGCKLSMDDFGVGAASLEALLKLPFTELKIDRMFVQPMQSDPKAVGIVKHILGMGKDLRIVVVAEGVEDAETLTLLRKLGCVVAQGFAISRPVSYDRILQFQRYDSADGLTEMV